MQRTLKQISYGQRQKKPSVTPRTSLSSYRMKPCGRELSFSGSSGSYWSIYWILAAPMWSPWATQYHLSGGCQDVLTGIVTVHFFHQSNDAPMSHRRDRYQDVLALRLDAYSWKKVTAHHVLYDFQNAGYNELVVFSLPNAMAKFSNMLIKFTNVKLWRTPLFTIFASLLGMIHLASLTATLFLEQWDEPGFLARLNPRCPSSVAAT